MPLDVPTEPLFTASSGSVGDLVFSRNQHGPYTRNRTVPTDPATAQQLAVRAAMTECVTAWNATLTETERRGWDAFALVLRRRTRLGRSTNAGGLGMYIRANVPRIQAAEVVLPRVDQAPTLRNSAPFTPITRVVFNPTDDTIHPFFTRSDPWTTEIGAAMLFWASPPVSTAVNFYNGPYRYAGAILGSALGPVQNPATIPLPFPATIADRIFIRGRLTRADARLSPSFRLPTELAAQTAPVPTAAVKSFAPFLIVKITFDQMLRIQTHDRRNWSARVTNNRYPALAAFSLPPTRTVIQVDFGFPAAEVGSDVVDYSPPPADVNGLLNGLPAAGFTNYPVV